ncbi:HlyD family secretion protein [Yoonia maricola]|uniref:HlyD family secretion protein n=2 Tax=Yoonia maricola TaxID=420999 RepID=A0A2M8W4V8_9RHOB|nr:HlyD family secretion protein [Yoonia maricola]
MQKWASRPDRILDVFWNAMDDATNNIAKLIKATAGQTIMTNESDELAKTLGLGSKKRWPWRLLAVVAIVAVGLAVWVFVPIGTSADRSVYVTETVGRGDIQVSVSATGTIEPTDLVEVSSELSGTITQVHVDYNDTVEVGSHLADLDTSRLEAQLALQNASLASAEAQIAIAEVTLRETRTEYERGLEMQQRGIESEQAFAAQEAAFDRARADLSSARAARDLAQANVDLVQIDLSKSCICSPIDGVVLDRAADEGQIVAASLEAPILFTIAGDLTRMELQIDIDESDIGRVEVGQPVIFTVEAYGDREFPAEMSALRFASENDDGIVTYKGILSLDNSEMVLLPGMTATADIIVASQTDVLVVSNSALRYTPPQELEESESSGSGLLGLVLPSRPSETGATRLSAESASVWVLRDGIAVEVPVQTGETDGYITEILSGDLTEGDQVIEDRIDAE